jgi:hypothetical protein
MISPLLHSRAEMAEFFKPVVAQIIRLIEAQVNTAKRLGYGDLNVSAIYQITARHGVTIMRRFSQSD